MTITHETASEPLIAPTHPRVPAQPPDEAVLGFADVAEPEADGREQEKKEDAKSALAFSKGEWLLAGIGVLLATGVSVIGLASSYRALEDKARRSVAEGGWAWQDPWMLPVGLDLSILAFSVINLLLIRVDARLGWVKWVPRLGAAATVYLNWVSATSVPNQLAHAALVCLWVIFSEVAAHIYAAHIGAVQGRERMDGIRLSRWFFNPMETAIVGRLMVLWEITSYAEALELQKKRKVYREWLKQKYGRWAWRWKASRSELLPETLAPYGVGVEEALGLPAEREASERLRRAEAEIRQADDLVSAELREAEAEVRRVEMRTKTKVAKLKAETEELNAQAALDTARAKAELAASEVVRQGEADLRQLEAESAAAAKKVTADAAAEAQRTAALAESEVAEQRRLEEKKQLRHEREQRMARWDLEEEGRVRAAEIQAKEEAARALSTAEIAEAQQRTDRALADSEKAKAEAAEAELRVAEAAGKTAEVARKTAEDLAAAKVAEADGERVAQEKRLRAAEIAELAAATELRAAEARRAAAEAEAEARLTPAERAARKVADWIEVRGLENVKLTHITDEFGVVGSTASAYRKRAEAIVAERAADRSGATPEPALVG
ncbi:DUF2637 domain-containing protein [Kitasatospora sp. RB6PN24]|uniref:DUF2637 domain-containing protein n=1 Tax=Kitasatospora humi TaxID=2893891 RepID=UPI001E62DE42|nr:DUF2637 domain-containing protein [Kitasatospora humi]MCC9310120.1 DUF2637 domain-containing protein [Kitasatospora humi]